MSDDLSEFQKEWRAIVLNNQADLRNDIASLRKDIQEMKGNYVPWSEFSDVKKDVEELKQFKSKFIGIIIAVNAVAAILGWALQTYLYWHNTTH